MRWQARVGDRRHRLELSTKEGDAVEAVVDGRQYTLSITEPQGNVYSILHEGASYEAIVHMKKDLCRVRFGRGVFDVIAEEAGGAGARRAGASRQSALSAVMPGRVLRVMVKPGDAVEARQGLVVVEAMKMENELAAPRDAVIKQVLAEPGAKVETGDVLIVFE